MGLSKPTEPKLRVDHRFSFTTEDDGQPPPTRSERLRRAPVPRSYFDATIFFLGKVLAIAQRLCVGFEHFFTSFTTLKDHEFV